MTPRERWHAVLDHTTPDRVPTDYWGTEEITTNLLRELKLNGTEELWSTLHIDKVRHVRPQYVGPTRPEGVDAFGVRHRSVTHAGGAGEYAEAADHPLSEMETVEDIEERYQWPRPEWWDFSTIRKQVDAVGDYPRQGGGSEPFLTYCNLRGMEQAYMDLALNPELVHHCLGRLYDLAYETTRRLLEAAGPRNIDLIYVAEDMGSQSSLLFSPAQIEEFFVPGFSRMTGLGHEAGARVFHHSDGSVRQIIPRMVDLGIDVLNPIQWRCEGIDRAELKSTFGDRLVFHGAMDNQETLPFGTPAQVADEVRENLRLLGQDGGYVLAPCHNLQSITPVENVIALYQTVHAEGRY